MPVYPVKNLKTGDTQELVMSVADYEQWRKDNPDWDKDWSQGCAGVGGKKNLSRKIQDGMKFFVRLQKCLVQQ